MGCIRLRKSRTASGISARKRVSLKDKGKPEVQPNPVSEDRFFWAEYLGWVFLGSLTVFFLVTSWRKWPDPLIDFGHDLYLSWRLAHGSLLYRDVDDIYGPLSQYLNAALFRVFGTSMMVLVRANLIVFAAILTAIYSLFRLAWGRLAAFVSLAIFIAVFAFGQSVVTGNYNYAAPYSHEATHGMLVCLLLVLALVWWVEQATVLRSFLAGGLLGLTAVLKAEFLLAGSLITLAALFMRWRSQKPVPFAAVAWWAAGVVLPTLGFTVYFSAYLPWGDALANASRGWLNVILTSRFTGDPVQIGFLGLDHPWENLIAHVEATLFAALALAGICAGAWLAERRKALWERVILGCVVAGGIGWIAIFRINWEPAGRCLLALALGYIVVTVSSAMRTAPPESGGRVQTLRLLIGVLAAALMARMFLNGRISQFGFYQAALAALLVPAVLIGEMPARFGFKNWGRSIVVAGGLALVVPGVLVYTGYSQHLLKMKTLSIGQGGDQFYAFPKEVDATGEIVRIVTEWLGKFSGDHTLVVLPEGEMINYLIRMPNPVSPFIFYSAATSEGREQKIVNDLERHPPDWIAIVSRDLSEYGIRHYGEAPGKGRNIMRWVAGNYELAASIGGNPLDGRIPGAVILRYRGKGGSPQP